LKEVPENFANSCSKLATVKWPENLEIIGMDAFKETGFTELVIPEGVKEIRDRAFRNCKNLVSVTIPASVEIIGGSAFYGCPELATVKMPAKTIKYMTYSMERWANLANPQDSYAFKECPLISKGSPLISKGSPLISKGNPSNLKGNPFTSKGNPFTSKGNPFNLKGNPFNLKGNPFNLKGFPSSLKGFLFTVFGGRNGPNLYLWKEY
jgi:hypothetical protein